jgi:hypothetical protein
MKSILAILAFFLSTIVYSQSDVWAKSDRNILYEECLSYLIKYKNTSQEQRESLSLCYLDGITNKYTKTDFQNKIDIELKRIKEAVISECSKNLGISLLISEVKEQVVEPKKEVSPISVKKATKKDSLIGKWNSNDKFTIEFQRGGKFKIDYLGNYFSPDTRGLVLGGKSGDYFIDSRGVLTLVLNWTEDVGNFKTKIRNFSQTNEYQIFDFTSDYFRWENKTIAEKSVQFNRIE